MPTKKQSRKKIKQKGARIIWVPVDLKLYFEDKIAQSIARDGPEGPKR